MFTLDLKVRDKVYAPTLSKKPLTVKEVREDMSYRCVLNDEYIDLTVMENGKLYKRAPQPVCFPYTQEWYEKLVVVYPGIEPFKNDAEAKNYIQVLRELFERFKLVSAVYSDVDLPTCPEVIRVNVAFCSEDFLDMYEYVVPVNPYTLKPCASIEDYLKR